MVKKLWEMWNNLSASEKQSFNNKATKLKKNEKVVANYKLKAKLDGVKGVKTLVSSLDTEKTLHKTLEDHCCQLLHLLDFITLVLITS